MQYGFETVPVKIKTQPKKDGIEIALHTYDDSFTVYYQVNEDTKKKYSRPFLIRDASDLNITFGRRQKALEDTISQRLTFHKAVGKNASTTNLFHSNYTAGGMNGVTNGMKGSSNFKDGNWQGYWGNDIEIRVLLDSLTEVSSFSAGFLQYNNAWIFLPEEVEYFTSIDGVQYEWVGVVKPKVSPKDKTQQTFDFDLSGNSRYARYVKLKAKSIGPCPDWHDAAGSDSWLFIDEIEIH